MEHSLLMILTALLLHGILSQEQEEFTISHNSSKTANQTTPQNFNNPDPPPSPCPTTKPCQNIKNITLPPVLARVKILWEKGSQCEGQLYVSTYDRREAPLCLMSHIPQNWLKGLCKDTRCGDFDKLTTILENANGYLIHSNMTVSNTLCPGLQITCQDPLGRELAAYKAVTGVLIFLILSAILLQFSRPTYNAIRKRFSQKRQNQWIGPTQSQSVSYHRGQAGGHPNNNTEKRKSYPGLEKLTVNSSREPSSNRNSDYDSFGYN